MKMTILFVSLTIAATASCQVPTGQALTIAFKDYFQSDNGNYYSGSSFLNFMEKEDTRGSRYLYDKWVKGSVTGVQGEAYNCDNLLFNYDKVEQKLLVLSDSSKVLGLNSGDIGAFNLTSNDSSYHFERLKNSTDMNFYQPVYKDDKGYSLYKLLVTKFKKADYHTNGIIESGNKFDEYDDEDHYFILTPKGEMIQINFKRKTIDKALESESSKVQAFFDQHKRDKLDEDLVKGLLQFLNGH